MSKKIKCIVKRPDEQFGHVTWVSDSLENLQKTVEGDFDVICFENGMAIICNKNRHCPSSGLLYNFPMNAPLHSYHCVLHNVPICGTVIICGVSDNKFIDIPVNFNTWRKLLESWIKENDRDKRKKYFIGYRKEQNENISDDSKYDHVIIYAFNEENARLIFKVYYPKKYHILSIVDTGEF